MNADEAASLTQKRCDRQASATHSGDLNKMRMERAEGPSKATLGLVDNEVALLWEVMPT